MATLNQITVGLENTMTPNTNNAAVQPKAAVIAPTYEELVARINQMEAEKNKQNATVGDRLSFKVKTGEGAKGALSCFGLGRFPVSLYPSQWKQLCSVLDAPQGNIVARAIQANADILTFKTPEEKLEIIAWATPVTK